MDPNTQIENKYAMDEEDALILIERTRQRRALLNEQLGRTPDPAPRKRVLENTTNQQPLSTLQDDESPKRHCQRDGETAKHTSSDRMQWNDTTQSENQPTPAAQSRKSRFAKLAQDLDNFECDMSHKTVNKQEEKKPRWQPPKGDGYTPNHHDAKDRHVSSPKKEYELYQGPTRTQNNGTNPAPSPKKTPAPGPPKPPRAASPERAPSPVQARSPKVSSQTVQLKQPQSVSSPKYTHQVRQVTNQKPVNSRVESDSGEEPTEKPVTERLSNWQKNTPSKPKPSDPTELPLSERFAGWEQRVSQTPDHPRPASQTPRPHATLVPTTPAPITPAPTTTAHTNQVSEPADKPVSDIRASWKEKEAASQTRREEEPTAYSVGDRMSAWEVMSSSNKVSYIKKIEPCSPSTTPSKGATWKPAGTPNKGLTPQKSFKESIEEKAAMMSKRATPGGNGLPPKPPTSVSRSPTKTHSPSKATTSPMKPSSPQAASPTGKVGSATKSLQQKILQQVQYSKTDKLADKIRQERMAEVNSLNNRYSNGVPKDSETESEASQVATAPAQPQGNTGRKEQQRAKARDDFNNKLQAMGFELSDEGTSTYTFDKNPGTSTGSSSKERQTGAKKPTSIYRLVSKKCAEENKPVVQRSSSSLKKVQFEEHNTSTESEGSTGQSEGQYTTDTDNTDDTEDDYEGQTAESQSETQDSFDETYNSGSESSIPDSYKSPSKRHETDYEQKVATNYDCRSQMSVEDDDISMSAFVPASVRRETVMPTRVDSSETGTGSYTSEQMDEQTRKKLRMEETDSEEEGDRAEMDDLLDEALDELDEETDDHNRDPVPIPRKRASHMYATTTGEVNLPENNEVQMRCKSDGLAYSVSMYRNSRHTTVTTKVDFRNVNPDAPPVAQRIVRNSHYTTQNVMEEDIQMPKQLPAEVQRKSLNERIEELQELVKQEQSVILQTSNALNKCCSGDSQFAGSAEQVECNRLLLISCQRRQGYMREIQRLKETRQLEPNNESGPKGSLTISDIRLPLKKDFVTKIGTASDTTVHYFIVLIRNGPHIIKTQMLSTHDPLMRGSLDFPNLIKVHGISSSFNINLEIYSMSVSREQHKDKKKKTPKKPKHATHMPLESPGGPTAVRTTSFFLITTMPITMKCLDKSSFNLDRIPYLSPLHGVIYMRLKCMMEQNVEERGFLTMFEDVSGLGAWYRRWCVLSGNKLCYWKYPDDENRKDPIGLIDLKRVITEKVGLIPRDVCARPHTFELVSVRPPRRGEQDTLVTKTFNTMTTTRFMLSADTKEERIVWCNRVNRALANIRTWHTDAMRPVKPSK